MGALAGASPTSGAQSPRRETAAAVPKASMRKTGTVKDARLRCSATSIGGPAL